MNNTIQDTDIHFVQACFIHIKRCEAVACNFLFARGTDMAVQVDYASAAKYPMTAPAARARTGVLRAAWVTDNQLGK